MVAIIKVAVLALVAVAGTTMAGIGVANAGKETQTTTLLNKASFSGQAAVRNATKRALTALSADAGFKAYVSKSVGDNAILGAAISDGQKLSTQLNKELSALKSKSSGLTPADQMAAATSLKAAYLAAQTGDATQATLGNTTTIANADGQGGTHEVSFVLPSGDVAALTTGNSQTSIKGIQKYWIGTVAANNAGIVNQYSTYFVTAFSAALSADKVGCNAFTGYYSSDGASSPTYSKAGCQ